MSVQTINFVCRLKTLKMSKILLAAKIESCKKIVVVPVNFIYGFDFVKTFNNSLNRNQKHLLFWSQNDKKEPNFNLAVSKVFNSSTDSCFHVKLLKAFSSKVDAAKYSQRRVFEPALYNERRLHEKPYPMTNPTRPNVQKATKSKTNVFTIETAKSKETEQPKRMTPPKRSERLATLIDVSNVAIDTPPISPVFMPEPDTNVTIRNRIDKNIIEKLVSIFHIILTRTNRPTKIQSSQTTMSFV